MKSKPRKLLFMPVEPIVPGQQVKLIPGKKNNQIVVHGYMEVDGLMGVVFEYKKIVI